MSTEVKIGDYVDMYEDRKALRLSLSLPALAVKDYMGTCGPIASLIASYLTVSCPERKKLLITLTFILNELLENAVKYVEPKESTLNVALILQGDFIIISITNPISKNQVNPLIEMADRLVDAEYAKTRCNDLPTTSGKWSGTSGIGLLSILKDHQASLGFRITLPNEGDGPEKYSIQAKMSIKEH